MSWIRNWFGQRNFNRAWKQAVEEKYASKEIDHKQYANCMEAANSPEAMRRARNQLRSDPDMLGGISDWNWEAIYQWFIDYFIPAMRIIIPIVIMFLQENPTPEDEETQS